MQLDNTMRQYSPSVNIIRDRNREINYIPTLNGQRAFEDIVASSAIGMRAFTLVGAYGTGKSTFLWALAQSVEKYNPYFDHFDYLIKGYASYQLVDLVGDFSSIQTAFAQVLGCDVSDSLNKIEELAQILKSESKGLIIRIDEFGKFLEYAAKHNPESDFYFIQQLAELINDASKNIILISTLHQDFAAYAYQLTDIQRKEWLKVKGRFKEITFNEPAEQLLLIASEKLNDTDFKVSKQQLNGLLEAVQAAKAFPLKDYFNIEVAQQLAPLDLLSGSILTLSLQRYGQNERSLFTFLESNDFHGLQQFVNHPNASFYSVAHVYDYLIYHYYAQLSIVQNPDYRAWRLMMDNIVRAEGLFEKDLLLEAIQLIKIVGLLNLFGRKSQRIDSDFLVHYASMTLGQQHSKEVLRQLEQFKIIRYRDFSNRYVLFHGTDVDIEEEIERAKAQVQEIRNISSYINSAFDFPIVIAKKYLLEVGTPRYFEFKASDEPLLLVPKREIDGYINLVFSTHQRAVDVAAISAQSEEAVLYVYFKYASHILEHIHKVEQIRVARNRHTEDPDAQKEFNALLAHHSELLRQSVLDAVYTADTSQVSFYYKGNPVTTITNRKSFNAYLSMIAQDVYSATPRFLNEMVNKSKLSANISNARKSLITNLIEHGDEENIGYATHLYPPDKTIYLALLRANGFHTNTAGVWQLSSPSSESFTAVWQEFTQFLESAKQSKRSLQDFVDLLLQHPFKLKKGLIDFILPIFLLIKKEDFAIYYQQTRFIPDLSADTLELIVRKPSDYVLKAFSIDGIRLGIFNQYREMLSQAETDHLSNKSFVNTIVPFLTFYKDLPAFAQKTQKITKEALRLREAITKATDPEKSFFEDFPQAIGYSLAELNEDEAKLQVYFERLRSSIKEIQLSFDALLDRYERYVKIDFLGVEEDLEFVAWKKLLEDRFRNIKTNVLPPHLKSFLQRINSPLEDKRAWLSSLAQILLGKSIDLIQDHEEEVLHQKFKEWVEELDNYSDIAKDVDEADINESYKIQLTNIASGMQSRVVKVPKAKLKQVKASEEIIQQSLTGDRNLDIFILVRILQEQLKK